MRRCRARALERTHRSTMGHWALRKRRFWKRPALWVVKRAYLGLTAM